MFVALGIALYSRLSSGFPTEQNAPAAATPFILRQTARIKLQEQASCDASSEARAMARMWSELEALGMRPIGTFRAAEDGRMMIAGQHPMNNIVALVTHVPGTAPFVNFLTLSAAGTVRMVSGEPGARALRLASLMVEPKRAPTLRFATAALAASGGRELDAASLVLLLEGIHAARMDEQLARPPTKSDMLAQARARRSSDKPSPKQLELAMEINRNAWIEAMRTALLDNARQQLKLDDEAWGQLERDLIVIHHGMSSDEVIATLSEHELVEALGAQIEKNKVGPAQLFNDINRRLDVAHQRQLVLRLVQPVQARLFARTQTLQDVGVESLLMAA